MAAEDALIDETVLNVAQTSGTVTMTAQLMGAWAAVVTVALVVIVAFIFR